MTASKNLEKRIAAVCRTSRNPMIDLNVFLVVSLLHP